ncbi:hypothetical protein CKF54_03570 [Psittacicella hinzii]|uniref:Uncharacterized protein n=1 Tax=Psittacicella hinzii TaxID=2028575 RepID=A0A3A1Y752_9GAMM|nr:GDSL-type esterase/lipase family protein [Psittacicella hinzii]RIY33136.1 hypothetical protein CKF54_03570 [Psittacicella hinzii]
MLNKFFKIYLTSITVFLFSCTNDTSVTQPKDYISNDSYIVDYSNNDLRTIQLKNKIKQAKKEGLTIVQLGDSHTAADVMTMYLRNRLRTYLGTGSIGYIAPMKVPGQYNSLIGYKSTNVSLINARNHKEYNYTIGGLVASFNSRGSIEYKAINGNTIPFSELKITTRCTALKDCIMIVSSDAGTETLSIRGNQWATYSVFIEGNFRISANANLELSGMYINNTNKGVTVSELGSNGATIYYLDTWGSDWTKQLAALKPDLVILAFGTNESYNQNFDSKQYIKDYSQLISSIKANTQAQVMLLSNPDTLNIAINKNLANTRCNNLQHAGVDTVYYDLVRIARSNQVLFWDWRQAMGGSCSAIKQQNAQILRNDGVHFSANGYRLFGYQLAHDIIKLGDK